MKYGQYDKKAKKTSIERLPSQLLEWHEVTYLRRYLYRLGLRVISANDPPWAYIPCNVVDQDMTHAHGSHPYTSFIPILKGCYAANLSYFKFWGFYTHTP